MSERLSQKMEKNNPENGCLEVGELSESLEDYVEIIYQLTQKNKVARVRDIAQAKKVKMSSVVSALKRLSNEGLVRHEVREFIELTKTGVDLGKKLTRRHEFLTRFLTEVLRIDPATAEKDACSLEHYISLKTMNSLYEFVEFLESRPRKVTELIDEFTRLPGQNSGEKPA